MVIVPIGIVLNILTIATFMRKRMRQKSNASVLYVALAVYDTLSLMNSILFVQLLPTLNIKIVNYADVWCKLGNLWRKMATQCPSWIQLILTFDRFRCVVYPHRFKFLDDKLKLTSILISVFLALMLINSAYLWFYTMPVLTTKVTFNSTTNQTVNRTTQSLNCTSSDDLALITDVINVLMRSYLPFVLMLALNIAMTRKFLASKKNSLRSRSLKREYVFTLTVFSIDIVFFVLYSPWSVYYILNRIVQSTPSLESSPLLAAQLGLFQSIAFCIAYLNNLNLFLINIVVNIIFRKEFLRMLKMESSKSELRLNKPQTNISMSLG